ncbi:MAG: hypothetical protein QXH81_03550 [Thermofilaceae archaeon]
MPVPPERAAEIAATVARIFNVPPPVIRYTDSIPSKGLYSSGTVYLRSDADERVLIHELAHHVHWAKGVRNGRAEEFASMLEDLLYPSYRYPSITTGRLLALAGVSFIIALAFTAAAGKAPKHPRDLEGWWNVATLTMQELVAALAAAAILG